jgi:hypothetical protein
MPRTTLFFGVSIVLLLLYLRVEGFVLGSFLLIPSMLLGMAIALLVAILAIGFFVTSAFTVAAVLARRAKWQWLLAIALPLGAMLAIANISSPRWRDAAMETLRKEVSEATLIDFAGDVRRTAEALHAKEPKRVALYRFPCPALEKLPDILQSFRGIDGAAIEPECSVWIDGVVVDVKYGYGREFWGLHIADAMSTEKSRMPRNLRPQDERLYERVWFSNSFDPPIE